MRKPRPKSLMNKMPAAASISRDSLVTLDTGGYCFFCLKKVEDQEDADAAGNEVSAELENKDGRRDVKRNFCKLVARYLETNFVRGSQQLPGQKMDEDDLMNKRLSTCPMIDIPSTCNDCYKLVENFCQLYSQMKSIELKVDWQMRKLKNIMTFAERAVTRNQRFKEHILKKSNKRMAQEELSRIVEFRKRFLRKSSRKFQRLNPRIILKRRGETCNDNRLSTKKLKKSAHVQTEDMSEALSSSQNEIIMIDRVYSLQNYGEDSNGTNGDNIENVPLQNTISSFKAESAEESHWNYFSGSPDKISEADESLSDRVFVRTAAGDSHQSQNLDDGSQDFDNEPHHDDVIEIHSDSEESTNTEVKSNSRESKKLTAKGKDDKKKKVPSESSTESNSSGFCVEWLHSSYNCTNCGIRFSNEIKLKEHIKTCTAEKEKNEEDDDVVMVENFSEGSKNVQHVKSGESEKPQENGGESSRAQNSQPQTKNTGNLEVREACNICKTSIRKSDMARHMSITHADSKTKTSQFYCRYCKKSFTTSYHLTRHKNTLMHKSNKRAAKNRKRDRMSNGNTNGPDPDTPDSGQKKNVKIVRIIYVTKPADEIASTEANNNGDGNETASSSV